MADKNIQVQLQIADTAVAKLSNGFDDVATSVKKADKAVKDASNDVKDFGNKGSESVQKLGVSTDTVLKRFIGLGAAVQAIRSFVSHITGTAEEIVKLGEEARKTGKSIREISEGAFTEEHLKGAQKYMDVLKQAQNVQKDFTAGFISDLGYVMMGLELLYNKMSGSGPQTAEDYMARVNSDAAVLANNAKMERALAEQKKNSEATTEKSHEKVLDYYKKELSLQQKLAEAGKKQADDFAKSFGRLSDEDQETAKYLEKKFASGQKMNPEEMKKARELGIFDEDTSKADAERGLKSGAGDFRRYQTGRAQQERAEIASEVVSKAIEVAPMKVDGKVTVDKASVKEFAEAAAKAMRAEIEAAILRNNQAQAAGRRTGGL